MENVGHYIRILCFCRSLQAFENTFVRLEFGWYHLKSLLQPRDRYVQGDPYETCAICLEDYKTRDKLRILPCAHGYHAICIDPWLTKNRRICPVCKQKVVLANEFSDIESDTESRSETAPLLNNFNRYASSNSYRAMSDNGNTSSHNSQHSTISEATQNALASGNENSDRNVQGRL